MLLEDKICGLVIGNPKLEEAISDLLPADFRKICLPDSPRLKAALTQQRFDVLIADPSLPHTTAGEIVSLSHAVHPGTPLLLIAKSSDKNLATWALARGVTNLIAYPLRADDVAAKVQLALSMRAKREEDGLSEQELGHVYNLLKAYYYDTESVLHFIKVHNLTPRAIQAELDKKAHSGMCLFDQHLDYKMSR